MQKSILLSIVTFFALSFVVAIAQETDGASSPVVGNERLVIETKDKESPATKGLKLEREVRPRLPNGYPAVIDTAQKEQIYKIQMGYNTLIAMLELRIDLLKKERDAKVERVLTPDQLEKVRRPVRRAFQRPTRTEPQL